jgi:hypothetical protein
VHGYRSIVMLRGLECIVVDDDRDVNQILFTDIRFNSRERVFARAWEGTRLNGFADRIDGSIFRNGTSISGDIRAEAALCVIPAAWGEANERGGFEISDVAHVAFPHVRRWSRWWCRHWSLLRWKSINETVVWEIRSSRDPEYLERSSTLTR